MQSNQMTNPFLITGKLLHHVYSYNAAILNYSIGKNTINILKNGLVTLILTHCCFTKVHFKNLILRGSKNKLEIKLQLFISSKVIMIECLEALPFKNILEITMKLKKMTRLSCFNSNLNNKFSKLKLTMRKLLRKQSNILNQV